ncbi:unnamed protein product [Polarella glacialis]|uniref:Protein kinase domain-containing protein n=1 Tax=Polarella glacialis TaxID=89957 RepID=A0A813LT97_POLGL|nr:unnamed protein product [Polarella glacialis]
MANVRFEEGNVFGPEQDQFKVGRRLARGGQGTVYQCTRLSQGHEYAVKVIDSTAERFKSQQGEQNLRREIRNMEELHHPSVVNLLMHMWEDGLCLIVMDLAAGGDMHNKVLGEVDVALKAGVPFRGLGGSELASKHVTRQILDGLGYMHSHNIIHRDMKLENVLIVQSHPYATSPQSLATSEAVPTELLDVKITDLGLSKRVAAASPKSVFKRSFTKVGSPDFVAPEVLEGTYDHMADFWSFGVMLYALLCGQWPFEITSLDPDQHREAVSRIKASEPWQSATEEARSFVQGLLTIDRDERLSLVGCLSHAWLAKSSGKLIVNAAGLGEVPLKGVVRKVTGCAGYAVDSVKLDFWDGSNCQHGGKGGDARKSWQLRPDELIMEVVQEERWEFLGNALIFITSHTRVISIRGTEARKRRLFVAPVGCQIAGLQFDGSELVGIHLEKVGTDGLGSVAAIGGRVGSAVDQVVLILRDGSSREYGDPGGSQRGPWALQAEEYLVSVEQLVRDAFLGNSLVLRSSLGNIFKLRGMEASRSRRFAAPSCSQICGLEFNGSLLTGVQTCPEDGDTSQGLRMHPVIADEKR